MSNWESVTQLLCSEEPIELGRYHSHLSHTAPCRMLYSLSYYKFASKMIGSHKRVLDIECNEGLGSWVIAKECGFCQGIDNDPEAIAVAKKNFQEACVEFICEDFVDLKNGTWDAIIHFDDVKTAAVHNSEGNSSLIKKMASHLSSNGVALIGRANEITPSAPISSPELLLRETSRFFEHVFPFAAHEEIVHAGYHPFAHYTIVLCCQPRLEGI